MKITPRIALEVAHHEAVIRSTYVDSVGVNTWSVGLTSATGHNVDRYINNPQTMQHCMEIFLWALERYADDVREAFKGYLLSEAQFTAALSFHWNTGAIKRASWVKRFKAGDVAGARAAFMLYNKPKEIIRRRGEERDLFFDGVWAGDGKITEYTKLSSRRSPVWSSAIRRDIRGVIEAVLADADAPKPPAIDYEKINPTPAKKPWWLALLALFGKATK